MREFSPSGGQLKVIRPEQSFLDAASFDEKGFSGSLRSAGPDGRWAQVAPMHRARAWFGAAVIGERLSALGHRESRSHASSVPARIAQVRGGRYRGRAAAQQRRSVQRGGQRPVDRFPTPFGLQSRAKTTSAGKPKPIANKHTSAMLAGQ